MTKQEAILGLIPPGQKRPGKMRGGVLQIWVTRACDRACPCCTQGSNLRGNSGFISPDQFELACSSLSDYWGVVGVFGGNPALHPQFTELCGILRRYIPYEQRGIWCNHPRGNGPVMRDTFNPAVSNLNVHKDQMAYDEFRRTWPECKPVGLTTDSRHSPPYVAVQDVEPDEEKLWELVADCDINRHWSAMICVVRGELRGYFCEIAGAQAILHQADNDWPDYGLPVEPGWWRKPMEAFYSQAAWHCRRCGIPLRLYGPLSDDPDAHELVSATHLNILSPRSSTREVRLITQEAYQQIPTVGRMTNYLGNAQQ